MATHKSSLILSLVDRVSGPAVRVGAALKNLNGKLSRFGGFAGFGSAVGGFGTGYLSKAVVDEALELSKAKNALVAFGNLHEEQVGKIVQRAREIDAALPVSALDVIKSGVNFLKAGFDFDQTNAMLEAAARLQVLSQGELDSAQAARLHANAMYQLGLVSTDANKTLDNSNAILDYMARGAKSSNTNLTEMFEALKYAGPGLASFGLTLEDISTILAGTANAGYQASQGGVALRAAMGDVVGPTKKAREALERLKAASGIDFTSFQKGDRKPATAQTIISSLVPSGIDAAILRPFTAEFDRILASGLTLEETQSKLTSLIANILGDDSVIGASELSEAISSALRAGSTQFDLIGFLSGLRDAGATLKDFYDIFGERQGVRLFAIAQQDFDSLRKKIQESNSAIEQSDALMRGWAGSWDRMLAAISQFKQEFAEAGFMDTLISGVEKLTGFLSTLKQTNPALLKMMSYGLLAATAIGAIGLAAWPVAAGLSAIGSVASLALTPIAALTAGLFGLAYLMKGKIAAGAKGFGAGFMENLSPETLERTAAALDAVKRAWAGMKQFIGGSSDEATGGEAEGGWFMTGKRIGAALAKGINAVMGFDLGQFVQGMKDKIAQVDAAIMSMMGQLVFKVTGAAAGLYSAGVQIVQNLWDGMMSHWATFMAWVQTLPEQIKAAFAGMVVNIPIIGRFMGSSSGSPGSIPDMSGEAAIPARAKGGPVRRGGLYLTGERGPELFSPGASGYIHNARNTAGMLGGGGSANISISINGAGDPAAVAEAVNRKLQHLLGRSRQLSFEGRPVTT